eukprot:1143903-Pelagomonas_calceolata.AAC.1
MAMKFVSKFNGTSVVKSRLFELMKGELNIKGPTNTQKDGMNSYSFRFQAAYPPVWINGIIFKFGKGEDAIQRVLCENSCPGRALWNHELRGCILA